MTIYHQPPAPRPTHGPAPRPMTPPAPGPGLAPPQRKKKSNVGIWIGLVIIGLSVVVSVGLGILWLFALASQIDSVTVSGTEDVELASGQWTVSVPVGAPDTTVAVTDSEGRELEIRRFGSAAEGPVDGDEAGTEWLSVGTVDIPTDGIFSVDAGGDSAQLVSTDLAGVLVAHSLLLLSFIAGGVLFVIGVLVTLVGFIFRVA